MMNMSLLCLLIFLKHRTKSTVFDLIVERWKSEGLTKINRTQSEIVALMLHGNHFPLFSRHFTRAPPVISMLGPSTKVRESPQQVWVILRRPRTPAQDFTANHLIFQSVPKRLSWPANRQTHVAIRRAMSLAWLKATPNKISLQSSSKLNITGWSSEWVFPLANSDTTKTCQMYYHDITTANFVL